MPADTLGFLTQHCPNGVDHDINFLQHLIVPKPEDLETRLMQTLIADAILFAVLMLAAIHFDNQPLFEAHKVEHKIQEWMLAAEFETRDLPTTQAVPQVILGIRHMASQFALKRIVDDRTVCLPLHASILFLLGYRVYRAVATAFTCDVAWSRGFACNGSSESMLLSRQVGSRSG